jgi:hypothetical protein
MSDQIKPNATEAYTACFDMSKFTDLNCAQ